MARTKRTPSKNSGIKSASSSVAAIPVAVACELPRLAPQPSEIKKIVPRYRPKSDALRGTRTFKRNTELVIQKKVFQRIARETAREINPDIRFRPLAFLALQISAETYLQNLFEEANVCATHAKRPNQITVTDLKLANRIRGGM
jgi:histone H3/H4